MLFTRAVADRVPKTSGKLALAAASVIVGVTVAAVSCTVDTELGLAAEITAANVQAAGSGATAVISVDITAEIRVGAHAQGSRMFIVARADVLVGDTVVATVNLDRPAGFDGTLAPGVSRTLSLHGVTLPGAFDPAPLCTSPAPAVRVVLHWEDRTAMEMGTAEGAATSACTP